jgi:hypothetical protein
MRGHAGLPPATPPASSREVCELAGGPGQWPLAATACSSIFAPSGSAPGGRRTRSTVTVVRAAVSADGRFRGDRKAPVHRGRRPDGRGGRVLV